MRIRTGNLAIGVCCMAALLAGCGGGGASSVPVISASSNPIPGAKAPATVALHLPNYFKPSKQVAKSMKKTPAHPASVPNSALSITFTVNGVLASTVNLNPGQTLYFITIPLPLGTDTIVADLFDQPNGGGNKIATTVPPVTVTIVVNATNTVNVPLSGIATQVCPSPDDNLVLTGSSGTMNYSFFPVDADGNFLNPPYTPSFTVGMSGTPAPNLVLGTTTFTTPTTSTTLTWNTSAHGLATPTSSLPTVCTGDITFGGPYGYVTNFGDGTVSIFDQAQETLSISNTPAQSFDMGGNLTQPVGVVYDSKTTPFKIFIADFSQNHIVVVDGTKNAFRSTIDTHGLHPWGLSLSPDGQFLYATESGTTDQVEIFNAATETSLVQVTGVEQGSFPTGIATFDPVSVGLQTLIAERYQHTVSSFVRRSRPATPAAPSFLRSLTNQNPALDPNPVPSPFPLADAAFGIGHSPAGTGVKGSALVREVGAPGLEAVNLGPPVATGPQSIGGDLAEQFAIGPNPIAVSPGAGTTAWAVGSTNALYKLTFSVGNGWGLASCASLDLATSTCGQADTLDPVGVAYSDDGAILYVVDYGTAPNTFSSGGAVTIVNPAGPSPAASFGVGRDPLGIAIGTLPAGATPFARRPQPRAH